MLGCKRNCLLGRAGPEMLQCHLSDTHPLVFDTPVTTLTHNLLRSFGAQGHEAAKSCHCAQQLPIYCFPVPSIPSSLDNRLNPNNATALPTPTMAGMPCGNGRQWTPRVWKPSLIQLARREKLSVQLYKLLSLFYFRDKSLHAVLKSHAQGLFCTALPSTVNCINLI